MVKKIAYLICIFLIIACQNEQQQLESARAEAEKIHEEGLIKLQAGNMEEALALFNEAIEIDETFEQPHVNKVEVYLNTSEYEKAIKEIDLIIEKSPETAENWVLAGIFKEKQGDKKTAFEYYEKSIVKFQDRIDQKEESNNEDDFENSTMDDEIGILFSYILLEDFERLDDAMISFENKNPDSPLIESLLEFNKEVYMENIFPDYEPAE